MRQEPASSTDFAFRLFSQATAERPSDNVFISPTSVEIALAMTVNGARGATKRAILGALGLPENYSLRSLNQRQSSLMAALKSPDPKVELAIANAVWARQGVEFNKAFLNKNRKFYGAQVEALDFADQQAALARINGWCSQNTRGKIEKILEEIGGDAILFLMNAIYFKGAWAVEFNKSLTQERPFTLLSGATKQHPLMHQSGEYSYLRGEGFQAVSLPYGGGRVSAYVFLPDKSVGLRSFLESLDAATWDSWMSRFRTADGDIAVPRFKLEYETDLSRGLTSMGMGIAFDDSRADFGAMCPRSRVRISEVKHKTYVDVNEEGTEAAAVTSVGFECLSVSIKQRFSLVVDRPFLFAIRDNETGAPLFLGSIVDPK
ncbi:MAG TPA: serpin family protein [Candidatus Obscuribacterales bacterium]